MALNKVDYVDNQTIITAQNLNDIQNEIIKLQNQTKKYPLNLLDNSNFKNPIAQAGFNGYHGINLYPIDRWISWNQPATIGDGYITPNSPIDQRIPLSKISLTSTYTVVINFLDGSINYAYGNFIDSFGSYNIGIYAMSYVSGDNHVTVRLNTGNNIVSVALYEGLYVWDELPEYQPKDYIVELMECRRYFRRFGSTGNITWTWAVDIGGNLFSSINLGPMISRPSISYSGLAISNSSFSGENVSGVNIYSWDEHGGTCTFSLNTTATTTNQQIYRLGILANHYVDFYCELD